MLFRSKSGKGQHISLSLLNSLLALKSIHLAAQSDPDRYAGPRVGGANNPPERGWKTKDEPIFFSFGGSVGAEGRPGWVEFVKEVGLERLLDDKRFDKNGRNSTSHGTDVHALRGEYEKGFARHSAEYLVDVIRKYAGNAAVYQSADAAIRHPQTAALGIVQSVPAGAGAEVRVRAFPARFSRLKPQLKGNAPALGEHTASVRAECGLDADSG
jgi:crotonobetainyl-CoA:carnitine CoA-transferase CaiB-like acyl-CoA transferase